MSSSVTLRELLAKIARYRREYLDAILIRVQRTLRRTEMAPTTDRRGCLSVIGRASANPKAVSPSEVPTKPTESHARCVAAIRDCDRAVSVIQFR